MIESCEVVDKIQKQIELDSYWKLRYKKLHSDLNEVYNKMDATLSNLRKKELEYEGDIGDLEYCLIQAKIEEIAEFSGLLKLKVLFGYGDVE